MHSMVASQAHFRFSFLWGLSGLLVISEQLVALFQLGYSRSLEIEADEVSSATYWGRNQSARHGWFFEKVIDNKEKVTTDVSEEYIFETPTLERVKRIAKLNLGPALTFWNKNKTSKIRFQVCSAEKNIKRGIMEVSQHGGESFAYLKVKMSPRDQIISVRSPP